MKPVIGVATSQSAIHGYLDTHVSLYHGTLLAKGAFVFTAVPREGAHDIHAAFDADPSISALPDSLDAVLSDAALLKKLAKLALPKTAPSVRDARAALHALGVTHLFDPRLT
ncbi:MAG: hypothetical protein JWM87_745 [Candidatus Eremiobacteraeota bacterium]|nr:hypothetical protein [Candidatus Eremiobacteraeota bacterium]